MAGKLTHNVSFDFNLNSIAINISNANPPDEIMSIGLYNIPTNNPIEPINSNVMVSKPIFSKLSLLNSSFMKGEIK